MKMQARTCFALVPLALALTACSSDDDRDFAAVSESRGADALANPAAQAVFDPGNGVLPFPNNVFFAGSDDRTLNIPIADPEAPSARTSLALNLMDGFSTVAPITTAVTTALDPASLRIGETIRMFEVGTDETGAITGLGRELTAEDVTASERDNTLAIVPLVPLAPATTYAVYITDGVLSAAGEPLAAASAFTFARGATPLEGDALTAFNPALPQLEPLRAVTRPLIEAIATVENPLSVQQVSSAWSFTTQGIREVLEAVSEVATGTLSVAPSGVDTSTVPGGEGVADIWVGGLTLPYYQTAADPALEGAAAAASDQAAILGYWVREDDNERVVTRFQATPQKQSDESVPVLMTVPNASSPSGGTPPDSGWPIMIFQHGITRNRTDMLAVAETMARAGIVVIAIDLPVHGLTDPEDALHAAGNPFAPYERTFDIDLATEAENGDITFTPDGDIDSSGTHFYNLGNLVNSRDNLRQAVADLMALSAGIDGMQAVNPADGTMQAFPVDVSRKSLLGHSLGAIVGTTFLAYDTSVTSATLAMPGGGIAQLLANSATFGPVLQRAFANAAGGFDPAAYQRLLVASQTIVDSGDPINHAATIAEANGAGIHLIEVVGEPGVSDSDQTIPNAVAGAPLSGTEALARQLGLDAVADDATGSALVRFSRGNHGSILNPAAPEGAPESVVNGNAATTAEMQRQALMFALSGGTTIDIENADVIAPLDATIVPAIPPPPPVEMPAEDAPSSARP